jgi:hypothetical protein
MFKNVYLSATFALFSLSMSAQSIDRINAIQNTLQHIAQEKNTIMLNLKETLVFGNKALAYMQNKLNDAYESLTSQVSQVINIITKSEEFNYSINEVTNLQTMYIVDRNMHFDDITYDPADYPLDAAIDRQITKSFPSLDEDTNQLFNIHYVIHATITGSKMLLEKLELKSQELTKELEALQNSPQA